MYLLSSNKSQLKKQKRIFRKNLTAPLKKLHILKKTFERYWNILIPIFFLIIKAVKYEILNPKSVTMNEVYGFVNDMEWNDGVLSCMMSRLCK